MLLIALGKNILPNNNRRAVFFFFFARCTSMVRRVPSFLPQSDQRARPTVGYMARAGSSSTRSFLGYSATTLLGRHGSGAWRRIEPTEIDRSHHRGTSAVSGAWSRRQMMVLGVCPAGAYRSIHAWWVKITDSPVYYRPSDRAWENAKGKNREKKKALFCRE